MVSGIIYCINCPHHCIGEEKSVTQDIRYQSNCHYHVICEEKCILRMLQSHFKMLQYRVISFFFNEIFFGMQTKKSLNLTTIEKLKSYETPPLPTVKCHYHLNSEEK